MANYCINETVRLGATFTQSSNYDPVVVTCKVASPAGTKTTYIYGTDAALQKDGTGIYHLDIVPTLTGIWTYRFEGVSGTLSAASESSFFAEPSAF